MKYITFLTQARLFFISVIWLIYYETELCILRIVSGPQQGLALRSYFVLSFYLIVPTKFYYVLRFVSGIQRPTHTKLFAKPAYSFAS